MQARSLPATSVHPQIIPATVTAVRVELRLEATSELSIAWLEAPGQRARPIEPATIDRLDELARVTAEAEGRREFDASAVARRRLGEQLFELLDGPERTLTRRLEQAALDGSKLALTIALRSGGVTRLAEHPAAKWRWELVADEHGPLMVRRELTLAVQLGDICSTGPRTLDHGGLRILFMAYSPRDAEPELNYEGEEERLLAALAPFIEDGRAQIVVVEFGSLEDLGRALLGREFDVVHLSGHGMLGPTGPVLLMENQVGDVDRVSPARLLEVFERAARMPELVMISSCLSAGERDDIPSLTAQLIAGGVPAAIGWIQTIRDDLATEAAADIYQRLCTGHTPVDAVAFARTRLHAADPAGTSQQAANAWGTLHLVTRDAAGFVMDRRRPRPSAARIDHRETYQYLDQQGGMRVLETGFVGRRRALQRVLRVLLDGVEGERHRAGAVIFGNKGTGKSCLAARAIQRVANGLEDPSEFGVIVLHGKLDDALVFAQFERQAKRWNDQQAVLLLCDSSLGTMVERVSWLLDAHWKSRRMVIVLDDFEQNLSIRTEGRADLSAHAAALFQVLLPACRTNRAKLLVTTTARFEVPAAEAERQPLIEVPLGGFEPSSLSKLWMRGQIGDDGSEGELARILPSDWLVLCDRLGGNPRILEWARALLRVKTTEGIVESVAKAGAAMPKWAGHEMPSAAQQDELARLFLCHMAYDEAVARISEDVRTFVRRARVYELPVPSDALQGLCEGLAINLELHLPALQNLGLLEVGELDGEPAQRVSRLVEPEFVAEDAERWHAVAAEFWVWPDRHRALFERMMIVWAHALAGRCEELAAEVSFPISVQLDSARLYRESFQLAERHLHMFPEAEAGLAWAGFALYRLGDPVAAWRLFGRAEELALSRNASDLELRRILESGARILLALGRHDEAASRLTRAIALQERLDGHENDESERFASLLHDLAGVLKEQGDLSGARKLLERALTIWRKALGTDEHRDVAGSLHSLAGVLKEQGDLSGARQLLERVSLIVAKLFGTDEHSLVATSLHSLAVVLQDLGDLSGARERLERAITIKAKVFGTEEHPDVVASLHSLAVVLKAQGDLEGARQLLERVLTIKTKVFGTDEHPDVASSLHSLGRVLRAQGDLEGARKHLERVLAIETKVFGTDEHPDIVASLHSLAEVLMAQGDFKGARQLLERSSAIAATVFQTDEHPAVAASLHLLAEVLRAEGDLEGARQHLERSLEVWVKVYGTDEHPDVAGSLHELAGVLTAQGDLASAHRCLEHALSIKAKVFGTDEHPDVATSLHSLAGVLHLRGDISGARQYLERALAISVKVFGTDEHPDVASSIHNLAELLVAEGRREDAIATFRRVLEIDAKLHRTREHHDSAGTEVELAALLLQVGQTEEATALLRHARAVLADQVPHHPLLAEIPRLLGELPDQSPRPSTAQLAHYLANLALQARSGVSLEADDLQTLEELLEAFTAAGPPLVSVAQYLRAVADAAVLPTIPTDLPEPIAEFLDSVHEAAQDIDEDR